MSGGREKCALAPIAEGWTITIHSPMRLEPRRGVPDVDHVAVWRSDEKPAVTAWLCRQWVHDLIAATLSISKGSFDVVREDGDNRVLGCGCVARADQPSMPRGSPRHRAYPGE